MKCPYCSHTNTSVLESRIGQDFGSIRRRRQCESCDKRFTTYERVEGIDLNVIKKDGGKECFSREKLKKGILKATWKRPVSVEEIESLVDEVEQKLRQRTATEVKSWEIGKLVINRLKKVDPLSYLLFASVYRDFRTLEDFEEELGQLKEDVRKKGADTLLPERSEE